MLCNATEYPGFIPCLPIDDSPEELKLNEKEETKKKAQALPFAIAPIPIPQDEPDDAATQNIVALLYFLPASVNASPTAPPVAWTGSSCRQLCIVPPIRGSGSFAPSSSSSSVVHQARHKAMAIRLMGRTLPDKPEANVVQGAERSRATLNAGDPMAVLFACKWTSSATSSHDGDVICLGGMLKLCKCIHSNMHL